MVATDEVCDLSSIFQIDGVLTHTNGEGFNGLAAFTCRNGTNKGRIQSTGKKKTDLGICNQPLLHASNELFPDIAAYRFHVLLVIGFHSCDITIAIEDFVFIIMSGWERQDLCYKSNQIFRFTCKQDRSIWIIPVIEGADTNRVSCCDEGILLCIVEDAGKFRIQHGKHLAAVFFVQR